MTLALAKEPLFIIREFNYEDDWAFVGLTLLENYARESPITRDEKDPAKFHVEHKERLIKCVQRPGSRILIACLPDHAGTILGFAIYERNKVQDWRANIHYIFVRKAFRRHGIASAFLRKAGINPNAARATHWTFFTEHYGHKWPNLSFHPEFF